MAFARAQMSLRLLKREFIVYYDVFFSRKAAVPISLVLCSTIITIYVLHETGILL
ncbi:MAG: hypothetical protein ACQCN6_13070 [Candidatus Bathyarchaeia archaeon]